MVRVPRMRVFLRGAASQHRKTLDTQRGGRTSARGMRTSTAESYVNRIVWHYHCNNFLYPTCLLTPPLRHLERPKSQP